MISSTGRLEAAGVALLLLGLMLVARPLRADYVECVNRIIGEYEQPLSAKTKRVILVRIKNECGGEKRPLDGLELQCQRFALAVKKEKGKKAMMEALDRCHDLSEKMAARPQIDEECETKVCVQMKGTETCAANFQKQGGSGLEYCFKWIPFSLCIKKYDLLGDAFPDIVYWKSGSAAGKAECAKF